MLNFTSDKAVIYIFLLLIIIIYCGIEEMDFVCLTPAQEKYHLNHY